MPIYEYECAKCDEIKEILHPITAVPPEKCTECGGKLERLFSSSALNLGRYVSATAERHTRTLSVAQNARKEGQRLAEHAKKTGIKYDDLFEDHDHQ